LIFTDEASFRQDSTLHATWSRVGHPPEVPVTGERKNVKILGAIELWRTRFHYREDTVFNASSYLVFLEQLARSYRRQGAIFSRTMPPITRMRKFGVGSAPTAAGWRFINCRPTRRSSIPPSGCGNTRGGQERTTDILPAGQNSRPP